MTKFKSLGAALMHYFKQEPHSYPAVGAAEIVAFRHSMTDAERAAAKLELESYGYEFEIEKK